jgi:hypothetical protein
MVTGCARAPQPATLTRHPLSPEQATWQSRDAFVAAVRAGDTAGAGSVFASNAVLIAPNGDSVRGPQAIIARLSQSIPGGGPIVVSFGREGLDECVGAVREQLSYSAEWPETDTVGNATGKLAVFWQRDSAGELHVAWIAFPKRAMTRSLTAAECTSVSDSVLHSWRWAISVVPASLFSGNMADQSFSSILKDRGWTGVECSCALKDPKHTPLTDGSIIPPTLLSIQYHARPHLIAELAGGAYPKTTTMGAQQYPNRDYAQTRLWFSGGFAQAVLSYQMGVVQAGIGPAFQFSNWRMRDSVIPYSTGGYPSHTDYEWSETAVGVVGHLRVQWPFGRRAFLSVGTQWRTFSKVKTPTTPRFPEADVDQSGMMFGLGIGMFY